MTVRSMAIDGVVVRERHRPLSESFVAWLVDSIRRVGLRHPLSVLEDGTLVAGRHRLEACRRLGWTQVPVVVERLDALRGELAEIDENLVRLELTVLERAEHLARRKSLYEALHPETRRGGRPGRAGGGKLAKNDSVSSFVALAAEKAGVSPRTVQRDVLVARALPLDVRDALRRTPLADARVELAALASVSVRRQRQVLRLLARGEARGVREALRRLDRAALVASVERYAPPAGMFPVVVVDPPWPYPNASRFETEDRYQGIAPYPVMSLDAIRALRVPAREDALVWLWTTNAFMREAHDVAAAWGCQVKTILTWVKPRLGLGRWLRGRTEHCLLATRGSPVVRLTSQSTVLEAPAREHSRKPAEFYRLVEELCPARPLLELFAREPREGWVTSGAEADRFASTEDPRDIASPSRAT